MGMGFMFACQIFDRREPLATRGWELIDAYVDHRHPSHAARERRVREGSTPAQRAAGVGIVFFQSR